MKICILGDTQSPVLKCVTKLLYEANTDFDLFAHPRDIPPGVYDLGLSVWNKYILKRETLNATTHGWVNTHPSLLPHGRGSDPYYWAIAHNEPFGVTLHWMDEGVDTGPIIVQEIVPVYEMDTCKTLRDRAVQKMSALCEKHIVDICKFPAAWSAHSKPQTDNRPARRREEMIARRASWNTPYRLVLRELRAATSDANPFQIIREGDKTFKVTLTVEEV